MQDPRELLQGHTRGDLDRQLHALVLRERQLGAGVRATDATVHAATLAVDSGVPAARGPALAAADTGYGGVADVVARRTVRGLFPPRRTRVALAGGAVDASVTRAAFARTASAYGSDTRLETGVTPATYDLTVAVSNRTRAELRDRFDTPRAAASAVRTDRVTVVVRTWS